MAVRYARLVAALTALFVSTGAMAQGKDPTAADALFRQAREEMKGGNFASACPKFAESNRLDPAAGTVLNLAQCEHKFGKLASALTHYQEAIEQLPPGDPRIQVAKDGIAQVRPRVPRLTLKLPPDAPSGTTIIRDGVELGAASIGTALPVDPGEHVVVIKAPGRQESRQSVSIAEAESKTLVVEVGPAAATEPAPTEPGTPAPATTVPATGPLRGEPESSGGTLRTVGYVVGALGVVGLGVGTYFSIRAKSLDNDATSEGHYSDNPTGTAGYECDAYCADKTGESRDASKIGYAGLIGGGALLAGGLAMILLAPSPKAESAKTRTSINVAVGPAMTGVQVGGAW